MASTPEHVAPSVSKANTNAAPSSDTEPTVYHPPTSHDVRSPEGSQRPLSTNDRRTSAAAVAAAAAAAAAKMRFNTSQKHNNNNNSSSSASSPSSLSSNHHSSSHASHQSAKSPSPLMNHSGIKASAAPVLIQLPDSSNAKTLHHSSVPSQIHPSHFQQQSQTIDHNRSSQITSSPSPSPSSSSSHLAGEPSSCFSVSSSQSATQNIASKPPHAPKNCSSQQQQHLQQQQQNGADKNVNKHQPQSYVQQIPLPYFEAQQSSEQLPKQQQHQQHQQNQQQHQQNQFLNHQQQIHQQQHQQQQVQRKGEGFQGVPATRRTSDLQGQMSHQQSSVAASQLHKQIATIQQNASDPRICINPITKEEASLLRSASLMSPSYIENHNFVPHYQSNIVSAPVNVSVPSSQPSSSSSSFGSQPHPHPYSQSQPQPQQHSTHHSLSFQHHPPFPSSGPIQSNPPFLPQYHPDQVNHNQEIAPPRHNIFPQTSPATSSALPPASPHVPSPAMIPSPTTTVSPISQSPHANISHTPNPAQPSLSHQASPMTDSPGPVPKIEASSPLSTKKELLASLRAEISLQGSDTESSEPEDFDLISDFFPTYCDREEIDHLLKTEAAIGESSGQSQGSLVKKEQGLNEENGLEHSNGSAVSSTGTARMVDDADQPKSFLGSKNQPSFSARDSKEFSEQGLKKKGQTPQHVSFRSDPIRFSSTDNKYQWEAIKEDLSWRWKWVKLQIHELEQQEREGKQLIEEKRQKKQPFQTLINNEDPLFHSARTSRLIRPPSTRKLCRQPPFVLSARNSILEGVESHPLFSFNHHLRIPKNVTMLNTIVVTQPVAPPAPVPVPVPEPVVPDPPRQSSPEFEPQPPSSDMPIPDPLSPNLPFIRSQSVPSILAVANKPISKPRTTKKNLRTSQPVKLPQEPAPQKPAPPPKERKRAAKKSQSCDFTNGPEKSEGMSDIMDYGHLEDYDLPFPSQIDDFVSF